MCREDTASMVAKSVTVSNLEGSARSGFFIKVFHSTKIRLKKSSFTQRVFDAPFDNLFQ
jgi:hypothetical protein